MKGLGLFPASLSLARLAAANVEKTIFLGPPTANIPRQPPTLTDLQLHVLTPEHSSIRTYLQAEFSSPSSVKGTTTWLLLDDLVPGQRYEVRLCWAATQPTAFSLQTHKLETVWTSPELITSLAKYADSRHGLAPSGGEHKLVEPRPRHERNEERDASILFLQISAAADYHSANRMLMHMVEPVHVDIILDPFLLNLLPRSLLPTVGFITLVAVTAIFFAVQISKWLCVMAKLDTSDEKKKR